MNPVDELMEQGLAHGVFPGAALLVSRGEEIFHRAIYGKRMVSPEQHLLSFGTLFDVASLTKILATTSIAMRLTQMGQLDLEEPLADALPVFATSHYRTAKVRHLLEHTSGMPGYQPYYEKFQPESVPALDVDQTLEQYLNWISQEAPVSSIGEKRVYSDLDFIVLGAILAQKAQAPLRQLYHREVAKPLALRASGYSPFTSAMDQAGSVAATANDSWRGRVLCGEVDDQNAYVLGGAAGHAGIFTSLDDCHRLALELVRAAHGGSSWLLADTVSHFAGPDLSHCLGWDRPSQAHSQAGQFFQATTIGHLGFTGCSLWIDVEREIIAILLTNRVHPSRSNDQIKAFRPQLHDALFKYYRGLS
jgi:CubicO group peptidase (beta-lactamase class C family)